MLKKFRNCLNRLKTSLDMFEVGSDEFGLLNQFKLIK